ncbi:MAG: hypothetical protein PHP44_10625 [Kiritimatiellae bacterium]|nr:hypothetical protein [Kiritimatiellia bacterium]
MQKITILFLIMLLSFSRWLLAAVPEERGDGAQAGALRFLEEQMDVYHRALYVYEDAGSAGNHFIERARIGGPDGAHLPVMQEDCREQPFSGNTCIRCEFKGGKSNWGGWSFMHGAFLPGAEAPTLNWGELSDAGENLRGARRLTFHARGLEGGERVQFHCLGIGRDDFSGKAKVDHPESSMKITTPWITLTKEWREYSIELSGCDLSYVICGFGWNSKSSINRHRDITFYLDDIRYDQSRLGHPRLLTSYQVRHGATEADRVLANTAYVYDNALAVLAFLSAGNVSRARLVANALVYAQEHDRHYHDGRIRNAYQGGDLRLPAGWMPTGNARAARLPGWSDAKSGTWCEDANSAGTSVGNLAWSMLALISTYEATGEPQYILSAMKMGKWIVENCRDERGAGGFSAGFEGWEPEQEKLMYKSTEHNIDLFAVFTRLYAITQRPIWKENADHALCFVKAMWDGKEGKFWTGTQADGETIFCDVIPLDTQAWALLSLREEGVAFVKGLDYAEKCMAVSGGYDFNQDGDGVWYEGTAQMATVYAAMGQVEKASEILHRMRKAQHHSGGLYATDREEVTTGFYTLGGDEWLYYRRLHVGATAWFALAEMNRNPFWSLEDASSVMVARSGRQKTEIPD